MDHRDPHVPTNIDDAFASVLKSLHSASRQCKRYYRSCSPSAVGALDTRHCARFHTPTYTHSFRKNPLQTSEDIHLKVHPGTYAVTAGEWGTSQQQTHVIRVNKGQTVDLDFVL